MDESVAECLGEEQKEGLERLGLQSVRKCRSGKEHNGGVRGEEQQPYRSFTEAAGLVSCHLIQRG